MLTGEKILLAPLLRDHRQKLFQWRNDRSMTHLSSEFRPWSEFGHDQWLEAVSRRPDMHLFVILDLQGRAQIGWCFLSDINPTHRSARLGIAIGETTHLHRGYGSDAVRVLVDFAFRDLNVQRVWLDVFADNAPAIRAYEKCGFETEGVMRRHYFVAGAYKDARIMAILNPDG